MKKYLLAVLLLAGCVERDKPFRNPLYINHEPQDTVTYMIGKIHDTIYIHDTVTIKPKGKNKVYINDTITIAYYQPMVMKTLGIGELEPHNEYFDHWATKEDHRPVLDSQQLKELNEIVRKDIIRMRKLIMKDSLYMKDSPTIKQH